ncbi:MAG: ABC transporter substrate-binding protein, partial [Syntrophomonas sp.]|nr:ABC transporter substrate-binding protein [Syntrophomonas sp.]
MRFSSRRRGCNTLGKRFGFVPKSRLIVLLGLIAGTLIFIWSGFYLQKAIFSINMNGRPLQMAVIGPIDSLDPSPLKSRAQQLITSAIYEGLFYYDDQKHEVKPLLAKNWSYADEGKTIVINLKDGIMFSNGKELLASDVKSSWEDSFSKDQEWSNISMFMPIQGVAERIQGKSMEISGIQAIDKYTLKIGLTKPDAAFIHSLTSPNFWVSDRPKDAIACGTGPFIPQEINSEDLILIRNEAYHRGKPHLTALKVLSYKDESEALAAYKEGKVDYLESFLLQELPPIKDNPEYKDLFISQPVMEVYWLGFNLSRDPYANNYLLRRALNYAIDRESIINNLLGGAYLPARGAIPIGSAAYNEQMRGYTYDPEKAAQLLTEAGYPKGRGLNVLTLTYNRDPGHNQIAQEVARQLALLGITVRIQDCDWDYFTRQLSYKQLSFFRLGWQADYPDADNFLYTLFSSTAAGSSNLTGYRNPQVDQLLDASRAEYQDEKARLKLLKRAEEIIVDDAPCLWLFQKKANILLGKDVRNFKINNMEMI